MPTILVVDPHPVVRHGIGCLLREQLDGAIFIEVGSAAGALAVVRERDLDLIILEPDLPGTDGLRLIRELRARQPRAPVLAFTGLTADAFVERVLRAGAAGFLSKELPVSELAATVRCILTHQRAAGMGTPSSLPRGGGASTGAHAALSDRELQILRLLAQGRTGPEIGRLLSISPKTANTHRRCIYQKLGLTTLSQVTAYAFRQGLVHCRRVSNQD